MGDELRIARIFLALQIMDTKTWAEGLCSGPYREELHCREACDAPATHHDRGLLLCALHAPMGAEQTRVYPEHRLRMWRWARRVLDQETAE